MRTAGRDLVYTAHDKSNKPAMTVSPGEIFAVDTELCSGSWLKSLADRYHPEKTEGPNPTVVVAVEGARPGDCLAVRILAIEVDELGYTGYFHPDPALTGQILPGNNESNTRTLAIKDGEIIWHERLRIPVKPMIGTLGTAPEQEILLNSKGGPHGGNMDVQEVTTGSTVYLPVAVPLALLHIGDVHAIQGDGEINMAGGVECRARVTLQVGLPRPFGNQQQIRLENQDDIMTIACERSTDESFFAAAREMVRWLVGSYGFTEKDAYLLMGQLMASRCTQYVNPTRSCICKMPRWCLIP